jgi:hypothetical protein
MGSVSSRCENRRKFDRFANDRLLPAPEKLVGAQASQIPRRPVSSTLSVTVDCSR